MQNKTLTLKQLADKLNVSKSYIDKIIRTLGMHTELKKDGNKYIINPLQQRKIEQFLSVKKPHNETLTLMHTSERSEIEFLRSQLVERAKEIEKLHNILDQQQQLQLKTQNLLEEQKLIVSDDKNSNIEVEKFKDFFENQQLNTFKSELEQKKLENEQLKKQVAELQQTAKKGFWQRLFNH